MNKLKTLTAINYCLNIFYFSECLYNNNWRLCKLNCYLEVSKTLLWSIDNIIIVHGYFSKITNEQINIIRNLHTIK